MDDQGYADVGFNGSKDIRTPNIDRIASGDTYFKDNFPADIKGLRYYKTLLAS